MFIKLPLKSLLFFPCALSISSVFGQWATNPSVNNPICRIEGAQEFPSIAQDVDGGAFICWRDFRNGLNLNIMAQKVTGNATISWFPGGTIVCDAPGDQFDPSVISDGLGGSIYAWNDNRLGQNSSGLYMQKLHANGQRLWQDEGLMITADSVVTEAPKMLADGLGGAFIVWEDIRVESGDRGDIYAQHVNAAGEPLWGDRGIPICKVKYSDQQTPSIVSDGAGGIYICWEDVDIYAQRVNANGEIQWPLNGVKVSPSETIDRNAVSLGTDNGELIVVWSNSFSNYLYAQRLNRAGQLLWGDSQEGIRIDGDTQSNFKPKIISDNNNGAFVSWQSDVTQGVVQHITQDGTLLSSPTLITSQWFNQKNIKMVTDGANGAILVWEDNRKEFTPYNQSLYAQKVNSDGLKLWDADGVPISLASTVVDDYDSKEYMQVVSNGTGGAILTWMEYRNLATTDKDIYAQLIGEGGVLPVEVTASLNEDDFTNSDFIIYPNPSKKTASLSLRLGTPSTIEFSIINLSGQVISSEFHQVLESGNYIFDLPVSNLSDGVYTIQLQTNSGVQYKKFCIQK